MNSASASLQAGVHMVYRFASCMAGCSPVDVPQGQSRLHQPIRVRVRVKLFRKRFVVKRKV